MHEYQSRTATLGFQYPIETSKIETSKEKVREWLDKVACYQQAQYNLSQILELQPKPGPKAQYVCLSWQFFRSKN